MTDQPLSEKLGQFLRGNWTGDKRIQGIQGGARAYLLALAAAEAQRPLLVIAPSANQAENLYDDLAFFLGEERGLAPLRRRLHLFPVLGSTAVRKSLAPSGKHRRPLGRALQTGRRDRRRS